MKFTSALAATASGSIGGATASRNRGGQYFRRRAVPTNPNTDRQSTIRSAFAAAVTYWIENLNQGQRDAWTAYADGTPTTDALGQDLVLTGQQAWIRTATLAQQSGQLLSAFEDAPVVNDRGNPPVHFTADGDVDAIGLDDGDTMTSADAVVNAGTSAAGRLLIYLGNPVNPSRRFYKGPYQFSGQVQFTASQTTLGWNVSQDTLAQTIPLTVGQLRPYRLRILYDDGRVPKDVMRIGSVVEIPT